MDIEKIKDYIAKRLLKLYAKQYKDDPAWAWDKIREAIPGSSAAEKREIIRAIESTDLVRKFLNEEALTEAESMVQDNNLDLDELWRILEDR